MNDELGIMPIVAPYIQEKISEINSYKSLIKDNFLTDIKTIAVEGVTDREYILQAIKLYSPLLQKAIDDNKLRILANQECGGCRQIVEWGKAWCHSGFTSQICFVLDADDAGNSAKSSLNNDEAVALKVSKHSVKVCQLPKPCYAKELAKRRIILPITIENLIDASIWENALKNGWLSKRSSNQMKHILMDAIPEDKSVVDFQNTLLQEVSILPELLTHTVRNESKRIFCTTAIEKSNENPDILKALQPLVSDLETFFK